ncbi:MAG: spore germination protein [Firmicutes bacterium]|nr:spore germination protein [Bacillota bacterium]
MDLWLNSVKEKYKNKLGGSFDAKTDEISGAKGSAVLVYLDSIVNRDLLQRDVICPFQSPDFCGNAEKLAYCTEAKSEEEFGTEILGGMTGLAYNNKLYLIDLKQWDKRSVSPPDAENVTRGPKEAFTEDLLTNTSLLRRKVKSENLVLKKFKLGRQTNTTVILAYIKGIAKDDIIKKVEKRLSEIDIDGVFDSGSVEQLLEKNYFNPVSGIGVTQKPDIAGQKILEGRVAVFVDGSPHVLTIPELFIENLHTAEDYYHRTFYSSLIRCLRVFGLMISIMLPGIAVAIICFNREMIPSGLFETIVSNAERTPLPLAVELFFVLLMIELLKESGARLPKTIGSAVSIVGALIIGEAAVRAGLVGAPTVMIAALTAVSSFIASSLNEFSTIYRYVFLFLGATFGLLGVGVGIAIMLISLASVNPFGIPILTMFDKSELKDMVLRFPLKRLKTRPKSIAEGNIQRTR